MSARRSTRTKAPVKYTSDSEGSEYGEKPTKRTPSKPQSKANTKKRTKANQDPSEFKADATPKKRTKKDPETLAAEHAEKAQIQEEKAAKQQHKKGWEDWLSSHDLKGALLDAEPGKDEIITQTDSQKKYGLKPNELGSLKHAEKRHPIYNNTTKLFVEEEVKKLAFRKYGMLAGIEGGESAILRRGEGLWKEEHKNDSLSTPKKADHPTEPASTSKPKTPKQKWTTYVETRTIATNNKLDVEPEEAINQTDSKTKYSLTPADLAVLPYFPKPNPKYGNTTKLFKEGEVKALAYRKAAYLGGKENGEEEAVLKAGKDLFESKKDGE